MMTDTNPQRLIGAKRRLEVLYFLARAGYATTRQLAFYCTGSASKNKTNMLNRTLSRMLADRLIHERVDRLQTERFVALTATGAHLAVKKIPALKGEVPSVCDNLRHVNSHRTAANGILAYYLRKYPSAAGHVVRSEIEIAANRALGQMQYWSGPDNRSLDKVADGIIKVSRNNQWHSYWLEVENSYRSPRDLQRLVAFCRQWYRNRFQPFGTLVLIITDDCAKTVGERLFKALQQAAHDDYDFGAGVPFLMQRIQILEFDAASNEVRPTV